MNLSVSAHCSAAQDTNGRITAYKQRLRGMIRLLAILGHCFLFGLFVESNVLPSAHYVFSVPFVLRFLLSQLLNINRTALSSAMNAFESALKIGQLAEIELRHSIPTIYSV